MPTSMACPAALEIRCARQDAWRCAVGLLAAVSAAASVLWWAGLAAPRAGWELALMSSVCALAAGCAAGLLRARPAPVLRWDGQRWWLMRGPAPPQAGTLGAAIDLGDWMLLRFAPEGGSPWRGRRWIPAQRRGLEGDWHALRCRVHGSRPGGEAAPA